MTLVRLSTYIAIAGAFTANAVTGVVVGAICRLYAKAFSDLLEGQPLPAATEFVVSYTRSIAPELVGAGIGLFFAIALCAAERSERARPHLPLLLSFGWVVPVLHLSCTAMAMVLPFINSLDSLH